MWSAQACKPTTASQDVARLKLLRTGSCASANQKIRLRKLNSLFRARLSSCQASKQLRTPKLLCVSCKPRFLDREKAAGSPRPVQVVNCAPFGGLVPCRRRKPACPASPSYNRKRGSPVLAPWSYWLSEDRWDTRWGQCKMDRYRKVQMRMDKTPQVQYLRETKQTDISVSMTRIVSGSCYEYFVDRTRTTCSLRFLEDEDGFRS